MNVTIRSLVVGILAFSVMHAALAQRLDAATFKAQIPPASSEPAPETFDAWNNPAVSIGRDGIYLLKPGQFPARETISTEALRAKFLTLPRSAWPRGRVVAVLQQSIRSGDDNEVIERHFEQLLVMLEELQIAVLLWPSG